MYRVYITMAEERSWYEFLHQRNVYHSNFRSKHFDVPAEKITDKLRRFLSQECQGRKIEIVVYNDNIPHFLRDLPFLLHTDKLIFWGSKRYCLKGISASTFENLPHLKSLSLDSIEDKEIYRIIAHRDIEHLKIYSVHSDFISIYAKELVISRKRTLRSFSYRSRDHYTDNGSIQELLQILCDMPELTILHINHWFGSFLNQTDFVDQNSKALADLISRGKLRTLSFMGAKTGEEVFTAVAGSQIEDLCIYTGGSGERLARILASNHHLRHVKCCLDDYQPVIEVLKEQNTTLLSLKNAMGKFDRKFASQGIPLLTRNILLHFYSSSILWILPMELFYLIISFL